MLRRLRSSQFATILPLLWLSVAVSQGVPVAVNDSYSSNEDTPLVTGGGTIFGADFEASANILAGAWSFLDKIKNNQAGQTPDGYPTDGGSRDWRALDFDTATSTIGPWGTSPMPIVGGTLDGVTGANNVLTGMSAGGLPFTVTTYLMRKTFTASAAQASVANWTLHALTDDGAVFYLNGQEIYRLNMDPANFIPSGALTTVTGAALGNELTYTDVVLDLTGKLVAGPNVLSVEVHQTHDNGTFTSSDTGLDCTLTPGGGSTAGFVYVDNTFGTNAADNASGAHLPTGGFNGTGGLFVDLGYRPPQNNGFQRQSSGAWRRTFTTALATAVRFTGRYRIMTKGGLETNEYGDFILDVNGTRYGSEGTAPSLRIERLLGPNATNQGNSLQTDTGWKQFTQDVSLGAGTHTLTLGLYNNNSTADTEHVELYLDDLEVSQLSGGNTVLSNDTGGAISAALVATTTNGTLNFQPSGIFTYTPGANFSGQDTFTYRASDGVDTSNVATVTITVNPVNDPPVGVTESYAAERDVVLNVPVGTGVLANDTDIDTPPASLTAVLVAPPAVGQVVLNANGSFAFTPAPGYVGADSFSYRASDGTAQSNLVTVNITVTGVSPPVGVADDYTMVRNTTLNVTNVSASTVTEDVNPFLAPAWRYLDNGSDQGTAWRAAGFNDSAWLSGAAELGYGDVDEATVVEDDATPGSPTAGSSTRYVTTYFRRAFTVTDIHRVTNVEVALKHDDAGIVYLNGTQVLITTGLSANPAFDTLSSVSHENITTTLNVTVPASALVEGTNVIAVEIHQQTRSSSDISMDARVRLTKAIYAGVLANDSDLEGDPLTANLVTPPATGAFNLNSNGTFSYTPTAGFTGDVTFGYRANDGTSNSVNTTATIHVISGPNQPPNTVADSYNATEEVQVNVAAPGVLGNDSDGEGDAFTAELVTGIAPAGAGGLSLNPNGSFTFTPALNFFGAATFTYRTRDVANAVSGPTTVTINVANINDLPVALNNSYSTDPGVTLNLPAPGVLGDDIDSDGDTLTAVLASPLSPAGAGSLNLSADGSLSFVPAVGFTGTATFTYRANDGTVNSATAATVTLKINGRPTAVNDAYNVSEDVLLTINAPGVLQNDTDTESDPLNAVLVSQPPAGEGVVSLNANGSFTFTPGLNFNGVTSFTYKANDGLRDSLNTATVTITVAPGNDAPSAVADTYGTPLNTPLFISAPGLLANDTDIENNPLTALPGSLPATGTLSLSTDGSFTYTPVAGFKGQVTFTYRASDGALPSTPATVTINVGVVPSDIVINEIMFHPASENDAEEYIELYNKGPVPVDLTGWKFTAGVNFTFPAVTVPAGGYIVVAANPATFSATYGGVPLLAGPWTGTLSNSGETIRLKFPDSTNAEGFSEADQVDYADEGDWGLRRAFTDSETGWDWQLRADGFGDSLELISPLISNNSGQNWTKREVAAAGNQRTPGAPNTDLAANPAIDSAPLISSVKHAPVIPRSTDPVVISAQVADELTTGLTARVFWRTWTPGQSTAAGNFVQLSMLDNGTGGDALANDGVFSATIPAQAVNTIVEFYVQSTDSSARSRTWPAPTTNGGAQGANCLYQVDESANTGRHPTYRFIATGLDQYEFEVARWNQNSNAGINITFISRQGTDEDIRYQSVLRVRGAGSRSRNPRNWKLSFPGDQPYRDQTQANINVWYSYLQYFGAQAMKCANLPHEGSIPVQVRLNGTNYATNTAASYGMYAHMQPIGDTSYDNENFSQDRGGNTYKKVRPHQNFTYNAGAGGIPNISAYIANGWSKQSNAGENNWSDLHNLMFQFTKAGGYTLADLEATIDVEQWARALAVTTIINDAETNFSNGANDDYGFYFGVTDPRCKVLMHDYDTIFGLGDSTSSTNETIYQVIAGNLSGGETIPAFTGFYSDPVVNQRFKAQLADLLNTIFLPANFDAMVDAELGDWPTMPESVRTSIKTFNAARRTAILGMINGGAFTASTSLTVQSGYPRTTVATDTGLGGTTDPVTVRKVLVNGISVTVNNYNSGANGAGTWTAGSAVTLQPGLNNVVVQALGANDAVLATQAFTIWYDNAAVTSVGAIAGNTSWTAAGGPYRVTAVLAVDNETLSIAPGTTVYFAAGAGFNITGTGRVLAEGSTNNRIRFALEPGTAGPRGGIVLNGTTQESRFNFVDIDGAGSLPAISLTNSVAYFGNIGFSGIGGQYFASTNSSFVFEDSAFPPVTGAALATVNGVPTSGYAIFRRNTFATSSGANNVARVTGGKRPGAIVQFLDNTFTGATNDAIELIGADAHIEGNAFLSVHQATAGADTANAVALARNGAVISEATIVRNLFHDCDHAVLSTGGSIATVVNNTIVNINNTGSASGSSASAFNSHEPARAGVVAGGAGRYDGNIVFNCPLAFENAASATGALTASLNMLPAALAAPVTGTGNLSSDPLLTSISGITAANIRASFALRPGSPATGTGPNSLDRGAIVPSGASISGEPFAVTPATSATLVIGGPGITHYKYSVDGGTFTSTETAVATPIVPTGLAAGMHSVRVIGKNSAGVWQDVLSPAQSREWTVDTAARNVIINEVLAVNVDALAVGATRPDYIELRNLSSAPVNLTGWRISDKPITLAAPGYVLNSVSIPANGYLILYADSETTQPGIHLLFGLSSDGEGVYLYHGATADTLVDSVTFGGQIADSSIGRMAPDFGWRLNTPTPGAANLSAPLGSPLTLKINEWLGTNNYIIEDDFIEIYNSVGLPVDLGGLRLTSDPNDLDLHVVHPLTFIAANGFIRFIADGNPQDGPAHLSWGVSKLREVIQIYTIDGVLIDHVVSGPQSADVSQGRSTDGSSAFTFFTTPTPGFSNNADLTAQNEILNNLRITEMMYNPPGGSTAPEFVELRNINGALPIDIGGVRFVNGIDYTFPVGTVIEPGEFIVITSNGPGFLSRYGFSASGVYTGKLDNSGERVRLEIGGFLLGIHDFTYSGSWYPSANSGGSIEIVNQLAGRDSWGLKSSWRPTAPNPGFNGAFGALAGPDLTTPGIAAVILEGSVTFGSVNPATVTRMWTKDLGPGAANFSAPTNEVTNVTFTQPGIYTLRLTATSGVTSVFDTVQVTVLESYASWVARLFPGESNPAIIGALSNPDRDSLVNLHEWAFGTNPNVSGSGNISAYINGGLLNLAYERSATSTANFVVEVSDDLVFWSSATVVESLTGNTGTVQTWLATDTRPVSASVRRFIRIRVTDN